MSDTPQSEPISRRVLVIGVLALASIFIVCASIGQAKFVPFALIKFDNPSAAVSNGQGTVVADQESERLLFLDESDQLTRAVELDRYEVPIKEATFLKQDGEYVYVAGATRAEDGESIVSEAVLAYAVDGTYLSKVWEKKYEKGEGPAPPSITGLGVQKNGNLLITRLDGTTTMPLYVELLEVNDKGEEQVLRSYKAPLDVPIHDADYLVDQDRILLVSESGDVALEGADGKEATVLYQASSTQRFQTVVVSGNYAELFNSAQGELLFTTDFIGGGKLHAVSSVPSVAYASIDGDLLTVVYGGDAVRVYDLKDTQHGHAADVQDARSSAAREIKQFSLSPQLNLMAVLTVLAWLFLIGLVLVLALRWLIGVFKAEERARLRRALAAFAGTALVIVTMGGHLLVTFTISSQGRSSQVKQSALYMASQAPGTIGDAAQREAQRTFGTLAPDENMTDYLILRRDVESLVQSYYQSSQGVQVTIYAISPDISDVRYLLSTTRDVVSGGKVTDQGLVDELNGLATKAREAQGDALEKASKVGEEELFLEGGRKDKSSVMLGYTVPLIASDGSCQAVAELSFQGETFFQHLMEHFYSTLFTLGLIAIGIYLLSDEVMRSGHAWLTYRSLRERGEESAHALLARPFLYLTNVASGIDTALAVVIAKEMLTKAGVDSNAFVWGVPALAITLGQTVATELYRRHSGRTPDRILALPCAVAGIGASVLCAFAVINDWFVPFVAGKFVMGLGYGVVSSAAFAVMNAVDKKALGDEQEIFAASRAVVGSTSSSARIIAGILGGLLAAAGNQWLYWGSAVVGLAVFALALVACPKGKAMGWLDETSKTASVTEYIFSPRMIGTALCAALPVILAGGYRSFIFPLFLEGANVSKVDIANFFVVGEAALYFATQWLIQVRNSSDSWKCIWLGMLGLAVTFALLSLNQSPVWAVLAIVFINVANWFAGGWKRLARRWAMDEHGFSYYDADAILRVESDVLKDARAPILSGLVALGGSVCCLSLAAILAVGAGLYVRVTKDNH